MNLADFTHVKIKLRGEGRDYDFTMEINQGYSAFYYKHTFETTKGEWTTIDLPLSDFQQKYFGRLTGKSSDPGTPFQRIGFLMNDKNTGAFQIEVDYIEFY